MHAPSRFRNLLCAGLVLSFCYGLTAQQGTGTPRPLVIPANEKEAPLAVFLDTSQVEVEAGKQVRLTARAWVTRGVTPEFAWTADLGRIEQGIVAGEAVFVAPTEPGMAQIVVTVAAPGHQPVSGNLALKIVASGALKRTAEVIVEVDTATLKKVWVNAEHPAENFAAPLRIKGTFRYDPETGDAFAGGSWPLYEMRDDGLAGDRVAGDGIWTIRFNFEKSDGKVYFALDDTNTYRVEYESGLAWRLKIAWIALDEFKDDMSNPAFIPNRDQVIRWTAEMAKEAGIYGPAR